ncbi:MAG: hypothetical protein LLP51_05035 [Halorhodospira halophila]|uniref:hypothetical protein n=1 Tax=Halorhodospira TaxID=85108 RepID=UPI0019118449|nr:MULTISPECIES: hypothetical protein [Halorhodospira]MBK5935856.1 hypothetical protein [Halorhodospira halophila]MBK5944610.1 hypothetical protein [Halorhodospira halophila]MCC3750749.1 hypothetical protein [Halorhodospira halophila]MCG5538115.1 hypothetical protein [Halorhodospira sp. 9622]MCG5540609.1 hypothetical protein [Halorhodospira sp. M39old]
MSREHAHAEQTQHDDHSPEVGTAPAQGQEAEGSALGRMFGATDENAFDSYEELDAHIKRTESAAMVRLIGAPAAAMVVLLGLHLVGAHQLAIALAFPVLFIVAIFMMTANINRYQARRLKRVRDNWAAE